LKTIVWFRGKELRVADHLALNSAAQRGGTSDEVLPIFVLDPYFFAAARAAEIPHRMQFLLQSISALDASLRRLGSRLILLRGKSVDVVPAVARALGADRVVAQRWSEPFARERDERVRAALGGKLELFGGETLCTPGTMRSGSERPFAVFSAFAKRFRNPEAREELRVQRPAPPLSKIRHWSANLPAEIAALESKLPDLESLGLTYNPRLQQGGQEAAGQRLQEFLRSVAVRYDQTRDQLGINGTSRLSADLKFGTLSVRTVWTACNELIDSGEATSVEAKRAVQSFTNELLWREFALHSLWDRPELMHRPFRADFEGFPWKTGDSPEWRAWCSGDTGYPVVDAAARQLLAEGFVHNRARMITASFLCKHLLIDYRQGERHFQKWLVDGDWALNNMGWQWSAGCGCDAQPYFRVFHPVTQGEKFDTNGDYVRRWVPALAKMPNQWIHKPWDAPAAVLRDAGVVLGNNYPKPIVKHETARERFLSTAKKHLKPEETLPK
jgi:deoxyribodipyrimidine photo-lyase